MSTVDPARFPDPSFDPPPATPGERRSVLAGGCFWCVEAVYRQLGGVSDVVNGYAGGGAAQADYATVSTGGTGHAEAVEIRYDPARVSYGQLLKVFFSIAHDPTTPGRQGNDIGPQYRSVIFYADEGEHAVAAAYVTQLAAAHVFEAPIVTELTKLERFFPAEAYHQDYAAKHPDQPYIRAVALPKVAKLRRYLSDRSKAPSR